MLISTVSISNLIFEHFFLKFLINTAPSYPCSYQVLMKQEICSTCQMQSMEHSRDMIFSLLISLLFALLASYFSGLAAYFPPPLFLCHYYSNKNTVHRPHHRCLPPFVITAGGASPLLPLDRRHCHCRHWTPIGPATWITPSGLTNGVRGIHTPQS
jgi:hypothetical protein